MKMCNRCKVQKDSSHFSKDKRSKSGLQTRCKPCQAEVKQEMSEYYRDWHLQYKYGIRSEDYERMLKEQNNSCSICGIEEKHCEHSRLAVDHDHGTGTVRELLCKKCNQAIGLLQDNNLFALKAHEYLKRHGK